MSEYKDPWLMHILLVTRKKERDFAVIVDYRREELRKQGIEYEDENGELPMSQRLIVAKFLLGPRELAEYAEFIKDWTSEVAKGVVARDAIIARLSTETIQEMADMLKTNYSTVYHTILPKLKRFEEHEGLKHFFQIYYREVDSVKDWRQTKKEWVKEDCWAEDDEDRLKFEPYYGLLEFRSNVASQYKRDMPEYLRDYDTDSEHNRKFIDNAKVEVEAGDKLWSEFQRWLSPEDRQLFA